MLFPTLTYLVSINVPASKTQTTKMLEKVQSFLSALQEFVLWPVIFCAVCFVESKWAQLKGVESSNVTVGMGWLPMHHYTPAIFSVLSVECAQQIHALWLYAAAECWHWTSSMKSGVDLQPTSHYRGTLPAILTGLHELWAWCQKFSVMELGGAQQISHKAGTKSLMSYSNFI